MAALPPNPASAPSVNPETGRGTGRSGAVRPPAEPVWHETKPAERPLSRHEHELAALLFSHGPLSRRDIVERTGTHPTLVGNAASGLIRRRIAREVRSPAGATSTRPPLGAGRPRLPLELDPAARHVVGLALRPGRVAAARLNLLGKPLPDSACAQTVSARNGSELTDAAARQLLQLLTPDTLAVGVTVPGIVDPDRRHLLLSAASPDTRGLDLSPLYQAAADVPVVLHNDMHALAARWQLTAHSPTDEDALLVYLADGSIGASLLIGGRPNRGCVIAAAELGHWQTGRPTEPCFCGRSGCLERVFSSQSLATPDLAAALAASPDPQGITTTLAAALADSAHLVRPHRLVIASPLAGVTGFAAHLTRRLRGFLLPGLVDHIQIDWWPDPPLATADTAGFLALSRLYRPAWA